MEASTSQVVSSPETAAKVVLRQRHETQIAPHGPPSRPTFVQFYHPANNLRFLSLPAYDYCPPNFGIHYGTAITACQILACNENGYLSTSRNRNPDGRINMDLDSIIPSGAYYYHLNSPNSKALYPICRDFDCWKFPHENLPSAWEDKSPPDPTPSIWPTNWSAISQKIKDRDAACLVSKWTESITTSHTVAKTAENWLVKNKMDVYLFGSQPLHQDPRNLFALRWDLHLGQFDQGRFVIVPKSGQLVVHFLQPGNHSVQRYHNIQFDHKDSLSHELLYARFAWALMKIVKNASLDAKVFNFSRASEDTIPEQRDIEGTNNGNGGGGGGSGGRGGGDSGGGGGGGSGGDVGGKRKRDEDGEEDGHYTYTSGPGGNLRSGKRFTSDAYPREDGSRLLLDRETQELEEDMKKAAQTLSFFVNPDREAGARHYENIVWYPGKAAVERRKQAYLDANPQIRAHSGRLLPHDHHLSDDENWT